MSNDDLFTLPADAKGSGVNMSDFEGRLIVVRPTGEETQVDTKMGESTYIPADVLDVEDPESGWQSVWVFSAGVRAQLKAAARQGKPIVGVLGHGTASPGKSAPWLVLDPDAKQIEKARDAYTKVAVPF